MPVKHEIIESISPTESIENVSAEWAIFGFILRLATYLLIAFRHQCLWTFIIQKCDSIIIISNHTKLISTATGATCGPHFHPTYSGLLDSPTVNLGPFSQKYKPAINDHVFHGLPFDVHNYSDKFDLTEQIKSYLLFWSDC